MTMADEDPTPNPHGLVCPRCGAPATASAYCGTCGLHLIEQDELPTRERWDRLQSDQALSAELVRAARELGELPDNSRRPTTSWGERWAALSSRARVATISLAAVLIVGVALVVVASGGGETERSAADLERSIERPVLRRSGIDGRGRRATSR